MRMQHKLVAPLLDKARTFGIFIIQEDLLFYCWVLFYKYITGRQTMIQVWGCDDNLSYHISKFLYVLDKFCNKSKEVSLKE